MAPTRVTPIIKDERVIQGAMQPVRSRGASVESREGNHVADAGCASSLVRRSPSQREVCHSQGTRQPGVEEGKQLYYSKYACQSCHIVDAKSDKGYTGPTLTGVGSRLTAA
jgi:hypothetical protein